MRIGGRKIDKRKKYDGRKEKRTNIGPHLNEMS